VVAANHFFKDTVKKANEVLAGTGIELRDEQAVGQAPAEVVLGKDRFAADVVKAGVSSAHFFRASPVAVTNGETGRVLVEAVGAGRPGDGFVAVAKVGKGEVAALGVSLWWHWIGDQKAAGADNAKLLRFLLTPSGDGT
jgi:hypothetical protein